MEHLDQPLFLLGHGVENPADGIHGDEEYLYVVELPTGNTFDKPGEWSVKVSDHCGFTPWDGPADEAFDRATWQFEGPLTVALEEVPLSLWRSDRSLLKLSNLIGLDRLPHSCSTVWCRLLCPQEGCRARERCAGRRREPFAR